MRRCNPSLYDLWNSLLHRPPLQGTASECPTTTTHHGNAYECHGHGFRYCPDSQGTNQLLNVKYTRATRFSIETAIGKLPLEDAILVGQVDCTSTHDWW